MNKSFKLTYKIGYEVFDSKKDLYNSFFSDFYEFLKKRTNVNLDKYKINNVKEFLDFCSNWNADNNHSFYGVGLAFGRYFVHLDVGGKLEDQPQTSFIGYLYQNNLYIEFIPFLMRFFAYWRTDENYTGSSADPTNTGNDFFADDWASLVDTCKFFHFSSLNLNDTYSWFNSVRVKDALDNIPGVNIGISNTSHHEDPIILKDITRENHIFLGWYDSLEENAKKISSVNREMTVYAKWLKKETEV